MRHISPLAAGAAVLALTLAACGGGDDSGEAADTDCTPDSELTVGALDKLRFDADSYEAGAGCIDVSYVNEGVVAHTLLVEGQSGFKLAVGDRDQGTIELPAGTYRLYCDIAGHEAAGMVAELTVS